MGRNRRETETEKKRVLGEALSGDVRVSRYSDLARTVKDHPIFKGVDFRVLACFVRNYCLKSGYILAEKPANDGNNYKGTTKNNGSDKRRRSDFDNIKSELRFKKGISLGEAQTAERVLEQFRPRYETIFEEREKLGKQVDDLTAKKTELEKGLSDKTCHDCATFQNKCKDEASKVLSDNAVLQSKLLSMSKELEELRTRLRQRAMAY